MAGAPARALDHLVLPCGDLEAAAGRFADLGFTVGRRNRHPWGTENHIIQFPGVFLELIALAPDFSPLLPGDDAFPFAGFLAGQGASAHPSGMVVLRSADAAADAASFRAAGLGTGRMLHFARDGQAPDGSIRSVAFTLAFAEASTMPEVGFFVCQQHHPENFWNPAAQQHPNGVTGIAEIGIAADHPADHTAVLQALLGRPLLETRDRRLVAMLPGDTAIVVEASPAPSRPRLVTIVFHGGAGPRRVHEAGTVQLEFGTRA